MENIDFPFYVVSLKHPVVFWILDFLFFLLVPQTTALNYLQLIMKIILEKMKFYYVYFKAFYVL